MASPALHLIVPAGLRAVSEAGVQIRDFLRAAGVDDLAAFQIELAVVEVVTNVVRHGCQNQEQVPIMVQVVLADGAVRTTIEDPGAPPPMRPGSAPKDPLAEGGRGIDIIYAVMDEVRHKVVRGGNIIELTKRVNRNASRAEMNS